MSKKGIKEAKRLLKNGADRADGEGWVFKFDITPFRPLFERQRIMVDVQRKSQLKLQNQRKRTFLLNIIKTLMQKPKLMIDKLTELECSK